ncbi:MAG: YfiT family bacillithiol transferase [Robiginitalea sp.]
MKDNTNQKLRYPIGHFDVPERITDLLLHNWISDLKRFPDKLSDLVQPLDARQLDTPYRPGGWTIRQVVHHLADSHHNSYMRFKWALTESTPLIKVYDEKSWASLFDSQTGPINLSLNHLRAVHEKLVYLLEGLDRGHLKRKFRHPESGLTSLEENVGRYVWHGNHHYAHIENLLRAKEWRR